MPRVPVYDAPQLQTSALRSVQQREFDVSSGAQALAGAVGQLGQMAQARADKQTLAEADAADAEISAGWLKWDAEARRKYQGNNVGEYEAQATKWWDDTRQAYGSKLSPQARERLSPVLQRKMGSALGSVAGHASAVRGQWADQQSEAAAQTTIEMSIDTGDAVGGAIRVRELAAERGARKGWSTEMVQAEQQRLLGTLHTAMIVKLAETNPVEATKYYTANKGEIPGPAQARMEQVLKAETDNQAASQFAAQHATLPLGQQLEKAGAITDPQRRAKTLQAVQSQHTMVKAAQTQREQQAADQAWQMVGQGKRVPEAVLGLMDGRQRVQLQDYLRDRAKQAASGDSVKTDWATYITLREKLAAGEKVDLRPYAGTKLAGPQLEQLLDIQTKKSDPNKAPEVASAEQQMSSYINQLGLSGERDQPKKGQFTAAAQDLFNEHLKRTGKEPTFDERRDILDKLVVETVTKPGLIWDTKAPTYTLPRDQLRAKVAPAGPVRVQSVEEARKLAPGTRFVDPSGVERIR